MYHPCRSVRSIPRALADSPLTDQVLDLDETLVHSTLDGCDEPDFSFPVAFNGREHRVHVRRRPHLQQFLQQCAELFEVVVFTASQKVYAEQLLNILDPSRFATLFRSQLGAILSNSYQVCISLYHCSRSRGPDCLEAGVRRTKQQRQYKKTSMHAGTVATHLMMNVAACLLFSNDCLLTCEGMCTQDADPAPRVPGLVCVCGGQLLEGPLRARPRPRAHRHR